MSDQKAGSAPIIYHMINGATQPVAPFCHATEFDGLVFVTGQMPDTPLEKGVLPAGIEAQTRNVMQNLLIILNGVGLSFDDVLSVRAFLTEFQRDYTIFNETYKSFFNEGCLPARTCIGTTGLAYDALVEIDVIARR